MSLKLYSEIEVNQQTAIELGLTAAEYKLILEKLGRTPTYTELGVFSVMWSEHCSYKNSIRLLKTLPKKGERLLVEAGEENAGLVDIGGGYAIAFKIESHNHPSAVEPFQGAATGVGGILRDVFTMGARPIAALNSLRFGKLDNPRVKYLLNGVVEGIAHYGNSFGVPTVGGEVYFDECYQDNPLVNAMAVGIVKTDKTASAASDGVGNPVVLIGSRTGRDGIHGASLLASREFDEETEDMRPTVQVGDPFAEKLLLEATLEMIDAGVIVGIQDMGAAGFSSSSTEMSARNGMGMNLNLDLVPLRESDMSAYEIMLSESQERMLAIIDKEKFDVAAKICDKWDVPFVKVGEVTGDGILHVWRNGNKVIEVNAEEFVLGGGAPVYEREAIKPTYIDKAKEYDLSELSNKEISKNDINLLLSSPIIASKKWVFEQYDSQVRTNTVSIKGDAAVIRIKEIENKAIALTTDCNSRYVYLDPYNGGLAAVAESARNVVCVGAKPVAITNCLNFGNPYDPSVYYQFSEAIRGMGDACKVLGTPVTGGNVSFHNESKDRAIFPTPTIGMLGIIDDMSKLMTAEFKNEGDSIFLLGENKEELGGSEFLNLMKNLITGEAPAVDINKEKNLQDLVLELIERKVINSAHDSSEGGIAISLIEKSIASQELGFEVNHQRNNAGFWFGESQGMILVTVGDNNRNLFVDTVEKSELKCIELGKVIKHVIKINNVELDWKSLKETYNNAIENRINAL